jgi:MYXO-CTERM domain-containing protein
MRSLAAAAVVAIVAPAFGAITTTTGSATITPIPPSLTIGAFESDTQVPVMFERNRILPEGQEVDISQIGLVDQLSDLTPGLIPAGTRVASYIFHADGIGTGNHVFEGSVTFDEDILGIIVGTTRLNNTDNRFGAVGTTYWNGPSRGLDLATNPGNDTLLLSVSRNTVSFRLVVGEAMDEFRVLTAVPTPGSFAVAALAAATTLRRRRSRAGTL